MDITHIFHMIEKNKIVIASAIIFLFIFVVPVIPLKISDTTLEMKPIVVQQTSVIQEPYNETTWVKVYYTTAVEPPVEKEDIPLLYHVKGDCTNRIPDFRSSSTTMLVYNLDSVPGDFTFFIGVEVKRNSDVEGTRYYEVEETPTKTIIISPCYYDCDEVTPTPTPVKPTNIVLGEEQTRYVEPGKYAEFSYSVDFDIKQCIFREKSIPTKTIYKEIGVRNRTGQIEYWYEPVNETKYRNRTITVNETVYRETETTREVSKRISVWKYLTRPKKVATTPVINYTRPPGER